MEKLQRFLFESNRLLFFSLILVLALFKSGIWFMPNIGASIQIAENPFRNPFADEPLAQYLVWNWLSPFLAYLLGLNGKWSFFSLHLLFSFCLWIVFAIYIFRKLKEQEARTALIIFSALPVSATSFFWVGMDSLTLLLMLLTILYAGTGILRLVFGILLGMQHFEQAFLSFVGLAYFFFGSKGQTTKICNFKSALTVLFGIVIGKLFLILIFQTLSVPVLITGRIIWTQHHFDSLVTNFALNFQTIFWCSFGLGWVILLKFCLMMDGILKFLTVLTFYALFIPFVDDQTRVFSILTFPTILSIWLLSPYFLKTWTKQEASFLFILWILLPWNWAWQGEGHDSVLSYTLAYLLGRMFGFVDLPPNLPLWPFT
ncbi:MAG: hypothetical protein NZO16_04085 [Deltaproteobacteria bacterium]|nr:hypothetical protein [Deltaproteobacteria bacterium]